MLTFFEAWPAFHICAGQAVLFALTIMGDPQLLFRTLEEPLKCPRSSIALRCTAETPQSSGGGGLSVSGAVVLRVSQTPCALNVCKTTSEGPNQISVFTHSKGTVSSAKSPRFPTRQLPSWFPRLHTQSSRRCL